MDQGDAAVWAAAITGGIGALGAVCAYAAGKAQARGMVEGVKLQLRGERDSAVWLAKRDASAGFLTAVDLYLSSFIHGQLTVSAHCEQQGAAGDEAAGAVDAVKQRYKELMLARASLRLSVDGSDLDLAEDLVDDAQQVLELLIGYEESYRRGANHRHEDRMEVYEVRLREGIQRWTRLAQRRLSVGSGHDG
ncbi:hypothetical protein [[Kitasatospora] papulosa]|uniref:hypothetical protein n=1 Tax=[Kitasatospora] papulosa TaxID=1464011 RepID=UPI0036C1C378